MFCNQCGKQLPDDTLFCPDCGAKQEVAVETPVQAVTPEPQIQPVPTPVQPVSQPVVQAMPEPTPAPAPGKKGGFPVKILIPVAAAFVVLVVLLVVLLTGKKGSGDYLKCTDDYIGYNYNAEAFCNLNGQTEEIEDIDNVYYSGDRSVIMYTTYENDTLYYFDSKFNSKEVSEDVCGVWMSLTGEYVAYAVDEGEGSYATTLYLYNVKTGKSEKIDTDVYAGSIALSPSGKAVAYLKDYESSTDNTLYVASVGKDSVKVDKDGCYPVLISDNAKNFYYINTDSKLYYYNGKDSKKIETGVSSTFYANSTVSEIMFNKNGKTYYYNPKLEEPVKVAGSAMSSWCAPGDQSMAVSTYNGYGCIIGKTSLKDMVFVADGYLYWLNKKGTEAVKMVSSSYLTYQLSEDGHSLLYINGGDLYKISKFNDEMKATELYDDEYLNYFIASADLSKIYVVTEDDELYYYKSAKKLEKISMDFEYNYDNIAFNEALGKIFYIEDDDLYSAGTTSKSKTLIEEDVDSVSGGCGGVLFSVYDDDEDIWTYYFMEKKDPKVMIEYEY